MKSFVNNILVWIILGILFTITTIYILSDYYNKLEKNARISKGIESFSLLKSTIDTVCNSFVGEKRIINILYPKDFNYIYGENSRICYNYDDINVCKDLNCKVNYFNITIYGENVYKEALEHNIVTFEIEIEKVELDKVNIKYTLKI